MLLLAAVLVVELGRVPQFAADGDTVALAYGSGKGIYVAVSNNAGRTFAPAVKVAEADVLPLGRHRGPRIVMAGGVMTVTAVVGKTVATGPHAHGLPADGDLLAWRSVDVGKTWSDPARANDVASSAREGLHALGVDGKGRLLAAWLDLRAQGTRLYGAASHDGGSSWGKNFLIYESPDGTICQCCHPSIAFDKSGAAAVLFRNALGGCRDLYLALATDGVTFGKAEKMGQSQWKLNACPMDGGGVAFSAGGPVTAWRRDQALFLSEPGKPEVQIGEGKDVALAARGGKVVAVWVSARGVEIWRRGAGPSEVASDKGSMPAVAVLPDGSVLAGWESDGGIIVRRFDYP
jgi:hypothetical protein